MPLSLKLLEKYRQLMWFCLVTPMVMMSNDLYLSMEHLVGSLVNNEREQMFSGSLRKFIILQPAFSWERGNWNKRSTTFLILDICLTNRLIPSKSEILSKIHMTWHQFLYAEKTQLEALRNPIREFLAIRCVFELCLYGIR